MGTKCLESPVEFKLGNVFTWGVKKDEFMFFGYTIPIVVGDEDAIKISTLAADVGATNPMYGKTIYLRSSLSAKQKTDLLNKGRNNILVHFKFTGVNTRKDVSYLVSKVTRLRKLDKPTDDEEVPED